MAISLETNIIANANMLTQDLEDETIFLHLQNEHYFSLDETGRDIWQALVEHHNIRAAIDTLVTKYEVNREQLTQDVLRLAADLVANELAEVSGPDKL
jgi:hypothetical protein